MHECPFYFWVIFIGVAAAFAIITGWFDLYIPKENNDESAIRDRKKVIVKNRVGIYRAYIILIVLIAISAILFLWWSFSTTKLNFNDFLSGLNSIIVTILTIALAFMALALAILFNAGLMATHMRLIESKYSKLYQENIEATIED